jgi:hypothetical protein
MPKKKFLKFSQAKTHATIDAVDAPSAMPRWLGSRGTVLSMDCKPGRLIATTASAYEIAIIKYIKRLI